MGIFQEDVIIAEAISQGLDDVRKHPWLIEDILSSFVKEPALQQKYGQKEIDNAKEWFLNNKIEVNMRFREDKDQFPCVTVAIGSSSEKEEMKHLGDLSPCVETLMPNQIGKPIPYVVKPFVPTEYNPNTGLLTIPDTISLFGVAVGQILVNPDTGDGYVIQDILADGILLEPNLDINANRLGIVPKYQIYKARREHTFFQTTLSIGCHVHGDPHTLLWLHSIVLYTILRYRESLLEGRDFTQSSVSSSDLITNQNYDGPAGDKVFSRFISLTGQVENSWLKTPYRLIEKVELGCETEEDGYNSGIKILSNLDSIPSLITENDLWTTIEDDENS
jgi:hypothetical protein